MKKNVLTFLTPLVFFSFLVLGLCLSLITPDKVTSLTEGRALAQKPVNDLSNLNALTQSYDDYFSDQFPGRERLLKLYTAAELLLGKQQVREVLRTSDGYLYMPESRLDEEPLSLLCQDLEAAAKKAPETAFVYAVVPQKTTMLSGSSDATLCRALQQVSGLDVIDVSGYFLENLTLAERKSLFFRTDFHWNSEGAFVASGCIAQGLQELGLLDGVTLPSRSDFQWSDLGTGHSYNGDLNRRLSYLFSTQESIPFYEIANPSAISYFSSGDAPVAREALIARGLGEDVLDYNTISTDNLGFYRVHNPDARSPSTALVLKDSMENPMTDYLTTLFTDLIVVDPRSYAEPYDLNGLIEVYDIDLVLFVYHDHNISTELRDFLNR